MYAILPGCRGAGQCGKIHGCYDERMNPIVTMMGVNTKNEDYEMETWKKNLYVCWVGVFFLAVGVSQIGPMMPLYVEHLGVYDQGQIEMWSGLAFGICMFTLALFSPIWGKVADKYGRKPMLLRSSLGTGLVIVCMGFVHNVYEITALRFIEGMLTGYIAIATTMIAAQTPKEKVGWALGTLSTGVVGGNMLGPLIGGYLAITMGFRSMFLVIGALLFLVFFLSVCFIKEDFKPFPGKTPSLKEVWRQLDNRSLVIALFTTSFVMHFAILTIEPILTVYVMQLPAVAVGTAMMSGIIFASTGLASMLAGPTMGRISDRLGPHKVIPVVLLIMAVLFIPQALVDNAWQLLLLRFILGFVSIALMPAVNSLLKFNIREELIGQMFGLNQACQFMGVFLGAVIGGQIAAMIGIKAVFFITSALLMLNGAWAYFRVYRLHAEQGH